MTPVIPSSTSSISLIPGCTFDTKTTNRLIRCCNLRRSSRRTLYAQDCVLPLSTSLRLFPHIRTFGSHHKPRFGIASATGVDVDVAVEQADQPDSAVSEQDSVQTSETTASVDKSNAEESAAKSKQRSRPARKSEMPPVKDEELVPGATFTGKVRSIQPFGAFVDFGAFTDGLVHVSRLSDGYVKDVADVVSLGQEVKVKLVEANIETGRIALTMRESEPASGGDTSRPPQRTGQKSNQKRTEGRKTTKFVKGQDLEGTVKNKTRSGAFITLPEGEEGFLPASEEADEGFGSIMGDGSSLEIGQEVKVRVLRIARGQVTLTMKKDEDSKALDSKLQGTVFTATNPFLVAFRRNKDIASFLDEREKVEDSTEISSVDQVDQESKEMVELKSDGDSDETVSSSVLVEDEKVETENESDSSGTDPQASIEETEITSPEPDEDENVSITNEEQVQVPEETSGITSSSEQVDTPIIQENVIEDEKVEPVSDEITPEEQVAIPEETSSITSSNEQVDAPVIEDVAEGGDEKIEPVSEETISVTSEEQVEIPEEANSITSSVEQVDAPVIQENVIEETQVGEVIESQIEEMETKVEVDAEIPVATPIEDGNDVAATEQNGEASAPSPVEAATKGMMDCKRALSETEGDLVKAQEYLRKKGLASADKKASRATAEGRIGSYVHDSRIGVLIEVNCETDFVSRGDIFKELVNDLAMQVAACPQVQVLVPEDVPEETIQKEKEIEMQKEDLLSKPEQFRAKIVEGRIKKRLDELALLEQAYIKNDKVVVKDFVKSTIATIGENIKVNRFVRFNLGEGLEKRTQDFAAEVAAQTSAKKVSAPTTEQQPAPTEAVGLNGFATNAFSLFRAPKAVISAALVKQLREETGAGMMDCKKALSETGGDLEKAQEYLRKKGLSTADKKSSRLAAEGRIGSYIHDARIGVLIEVNCETDFVGRSEKFKELVDDLAMQVVACPKVEYVSIEDIPEHIVSKEKELEMQREDILSKPENIREKIVEGRVSKRLGELTLLEQAYLKDDSVLVKDFVKQTVAAIGENIKVRRFVRFTLGESSESKSEESSES
ncbi:Nucleic acid-binding, OB-fold [Cynara cardunculus var. scolymus]|uniref:Elongation factor Ts, mitochondrial n=1 Tax=Cynara cardunculus var. scolymus TaxID=59895 RepID=A0A118JW12_CYNCS|nr:Nucleic acid-binding, OB-fold [Cynara cardunculus var. scolymus]